MKTCTRCKQEKLLEEFVFNKRSGNYLNSCRKCKKYYQQNWHSIRKHNTNLQRRLEYQKSAEIRALCKDRELRKNFGISLSEYEQLLQVQQGKCLGCEKHESELLRKLAVDHCHKTGKVRGLLCGNCNTALGLVKENIKTLQNMMEYLGGR